MYGLAVPSLSIHISVQLAASLHFLEEKSTESKNQQNIHKQLCMFIFFLLYKKKTRAQMLKSLETLNATSKLLEAHFLRLGTWRIAI